MEGNLLASFAGILLSLGFGYIPGLKDRYDTLVAQQKALVMAGLLLVAALGVFGLSCWGPFEYATCDQGGAWALAEMFVTALIANQATYQIAVKPGQA